MLDFQSLGKRAFRICFPLFVARRCPGIRFSKRIAFPNHHEMRGIRLLDLRFAAAGKAQAVAFVLIDSKGWFEIQVVGVEAEQPENAAGLGEVAADHALQNGNLPAFPAFEIRCGQQVHFHEKLDGGDKSLAGEDS